MPLMKVRNKQPQLEEGCWVAPSADLIGDVQVGNNCSFWFNTTVRGDVMPIRIGDHTNIQDGSVVHGTLNKCGASIGSRVTVGHMVVLHGCEIGDECLIGMGSIIMDLAKIPNRCIVAAGSLVTEDAQFEEGHLIMGRPAKMQRKLTSAELEFLKISANNYIEYKSWYEEQERTPQ